MTVKATLMIPKTYICSLECGRVVAKHSKRCNDQHLELERIDPADGFRVRLGHQRAGERSGRQLRCHGPVCWVSS